MIRRAKCRSVVLSVLMCCINISLLSYWQGVLTMQKLISWSSCQSEHLNVQHVPKKMLVCVWQGIEGTTLSKGVLFAWFYEGFSITGEFDMIRIRKQKLYNALLYNLLLISCRVKQAPEVATEPTNQHWDPRPPQWIFFWCINDVSTIDVLCIFLCLRVMWFNIIKIYTSFGQNIQNNCVH